MSRRAPPPAAGRAARASGWPAPAAPAGEDERHADPAQGAGRGEAEPRRPPRGAHRADRPTRCPPGSTGCSAADGVGTHAPAFNGSIKVAVGGVTADAAVVAVDGKVYAKLPFTSKFTPIDPADYGAPDPADLIGPAGRAVLAADLGPRREGGRPGPRRRSAVLTSYTGTVPGRTVAAIIPSARSSATVRRDLHHRRPAPAGQGRAARAVLPEGRRRHLHHDLRRLRHPARHHGAVTGPAGCCWRWRRWRSRSPPPTPTSWCSRCRT